MHVTSQARILSIEDDAEMRGLIQLIFERQGHHVVGVKRGEFGLELLKSLRPDILLLDLMLPDIDGWDLYARLKADDDMSQVPVIIISARDPEQDALEGLYVVGQDRFVEKPFEVKELISIVNGVLEKQPA